MICWKVILFLVDMMNKSTSWLIFLFKCYINWKFCFILWKKSVKCVITIFHLWQALSFLFLPIDKNSKYSIFLKYYLNSVNTLQALTNWSIVSIYIFKNKHRRASSSSFFFRDQNCFARGKLCLIDHSTLVLCPLTIVLFSTLQHL